MCSGVLRRAVLLVWAWTLAVCGGAWAEQPVPPLSGRVVDTAEMLTQAQRSGLEAQLAAVEIKRGTQIVVLLVASTAPEDIASYANRVANEWKLGRRQVGDGVLMVIARDDRRLRLEVAKALEGAVPDLAAKQIINTALVPALRAGRLAEGLTAAVAELDVRLGGEALPAAADAAAATRPGEPGFQWFDLLIFFLVAVPVGGAIAKGIFGNKLGSMVTGGAVGAMAYVVTASLWVAGIGAVLALVFTLMSSMGRRMNVGRAARRYHRGQGPNIGAWGSGSSPGGWGGHGDAGGGFSSGGGGDFGGGGASGGW